MKLLDLNNDCIFGGKKDFTIYWSIIQDIRDGQDYTLGNEDVGKRKYNFLVQLKCPLS